MKTGFWVAIVVALVGFVAPASADTIANFTLDGVTFDDGGTATGGFTLDLTSGILSNVNITTSDDGTFPFGLGDNYTGGTFTNSPSASFIFQNNYDVAFDALTINLSSALTPANLTGSASFPVTGGEFFAFIACTEFDSEGICASRAIIAGTLDTGVSATPVPAALPLFAGGLGLVGFLARRKKRNAGTAA